MAMAAFPEGWEPAWLDRRISNEIPGVRAFLAARFPGHDADELLAETLFRAARYWNSYDPSYRLYPWLVGIARNVGRDAAVRRARTAAIVSPGGLDDIDVPDDRGDPATIIDDATLSTRLTTALRGLPLRLRQAVWMRWVLGWTGAEVADWMGVSEKTVEMHLYRARRALRHRLGEANGSRHGAMVFVTGLIDRLHMRVLIIGERTHRLPHHLLSGIHHHPAASLAIMAVFLIT